MENAALETLLIEFAATLDTALKQQTLKARAGSGFSRLTIPLLRYIDAIAALGTPTISQLAERLNLSKPSVTAAVQKLARQGYVVKIPSTQDKRLVHVRLTGAAWGLMDAKIQTLVTYGGFVRSALSDEEARQFEHILAKLVRLFDQAASAPPLPNPDPIRPDDRQ